jgi:hypothetical protein
VGALSHVSRTIVISTYMDSPDSPMESERTLDPKRNPLVKSSVKRDRTSWRKPGQPLGRICCELGGKGPIGVPGHLVIGRVPVSEGLLGPGNHMHLVGVL